MTEEEKLRRQQFRSELETRTVRFAADVHRLIRRVRSVALCAVLLAADSAWAGAAGTPGARWVHSSRGLKGDADLVFLTNLVVRAADAGCCGILLHAGLEYAWRWNETERTRFARFRAVCDARKFEIMPQVWSPGYGTMLWLCPDLVESRESTDNAYVARGGRLVFEPAEAITCVNAGFEEFDGTKNAFPGFFTDRPGLISFQDREVRHSGAASVRIEPGKDGRHQGRITQAFNLKPNRRYSFSCWFKAEGLPNNFGVASLTVFPHPKCEGAPTGVLIPVDRTTGSCDWKKVGCTFETDEQAFAQVWIGSWKADSGRFWVDDWEVREEGLKEVACRPGTPFVVRNAKTGRAYRSGVDFALPEVRKHQNLTAPKGESISFPIPAGSAIREGDRVLIDAYVPSRNGGKQQLSTCMTDRRLYAAMRKSADGIMEVLGPRYWNLAIDEVRNRNTCPLCKARRTDGAHLLGEFVTEAVNIIRERCPNAEITGWADMLDPTHSGTGEFADTWKLVPKDFIPLCWNHGKRDAALRFFAEKGFAVMGSVCNDGREDAKFIRAWFDSLAPLGRKSKGLVFTTWTSDYDFLEDFGSN